MDHAIFNILQDGLKRAKKARYTFVEPNGQRISFKPFFSSLSLVDSTSYELEISNGGVMHSGKNPQRSFHGRVEVRMGDYERGGGTGSNTFSISQGLDMASSSKEIWESLNHAFWCCVEDYGQRNLNAMGSRNRREKYVYFSREPGARHAAEAADLTFDLPKVNDTLIEASRRLSEGMKVPFWTNVEFEAEKTDDYLVNSEGSRVFGSFSRYKTVLEVIALDSKNRYIPHNKVFYARRPSEIPNLDELMSEGEKLKEQVFDIVKAPIQKNGSYPVIMCPRNHGVLWHEVIGHALEGHRMQEDEEDFDDEERVTLFLGKIGKKIGPKFISVHDDPTALGKDGSYAYDSEGVKAQKVLLIERGVLRNYLHSRASAGFFKKHSNGHARASLSNDPVARMSNLFVKSSNETSIDELKEQLLGECRRQDEPYGLLFTDVQGGLTLPDECHFETYPSQVFRVYKNGETERVRGIYILGTPYQVMKNLILTGNDYDEFRGYCGAESGWVPSSITAPSALFNSIEINRIPDSSYGEIKKIVIPMPGSKKKK